MEYKARPRSGWTRFILVYGLPDARFPPKGFSKNILHPSGTVVNIYCIIYYSLNDGKPIFQSPFMAESRQTLCAKRFSNLSQMIFHSQPTDFPSSSQRNETWMKDA